MSKKNNNLPTKKEVTLTMYGVFLVIIILLLVGVFWLMDEEMLIVYGVMGCIVSGLFVWINFQILKRKYPVIIFQNLGEIFGGQETTTLTKEQIDEIKEQKKTERREDFNFQITTFLIISPLVLGYFGYISYGLPTTQTGLSITQYGEMVGMSSIYLGYVIRFLIGFIPYFISIIRKKSNKTLILVLCGIIFSSYMWGLYLSMTLGFSIKILLIIGWVVTLILSFMKD
tara:strand:+ start:79 stop:762 length:684 start_codon:yes stop_codon:yes gene_type:complete